MLCKGGKRLKQEHDAELGSEDAAFPLILFVIGES